MLKSIERLRDCTKRRAFNVSFEKTKLLEQLDAIEREVEERYVELPTDDNGKTVKYGGYAKVYPYDGEPMKVRALYRSGFGWSVIFTDGSKEPLYRVLVCEPPTVEDVLNEFASERIKLFLTAPIAVSDESVEEYRKDNYEACEKLIAEYAAKLQLREE